MGSDALVSGATSSRLRFARTGARLGGPRCAPQGMKLKIVFVRERSGGAGHFPRDVFFFFGLTAFPPASACFCFFFADIVNLRPTSLMPVM